MSTLLISSTVLITVLASLAFGIGCGYLAIAAILRAMGHQRRVSESAPRAAIAAPASSH
ncbi:MAG TPA: hypothetical protein VN176_17800 [Verrucomicrobiae bacterium]|jgi:hypothetical protein|nr:hypothetical protein [Verrucomicrobiae bacterium]